MTLRVFVLSALMAAAAAASAGAGQEPSLASLARKVEADRAEKKTKPVRTYTNADLATPSPAPAPPPESPASGYVSKTTGKEVSAEELLERSQEQVAEEESRKQPEPAWRTRAASIRTQVDTLAARLSRMEGRPRNPNAGMQQRAEQEMVMIRKLLQDQRKKWAALEADALEAKIPRNWIEPAPQFPAQ